MFLPQQGMILTNKQKLRNNQGCGSGSTLKKEAGSGNKLRTEQFISLPIT